MANVVVIVVIILIGGLTLLGGVSVFLTARRHTGWRRWANRGAGMLLVIGAVGFFGPGLSSSGALNWLPKSFEWPVVYARGVVFTHGGLAVVPHIASGRIQLYDANWHYVRGWHIGKGASRAFRLKISDDDQIEVITASGSWHTVFNLQGEMISQQHYPTDYPDKPSFYDTYPDTGESLYVPTRFWLIPFSHPITGWICLAGGLLLFNYVDKTDPKRKRRRQASRPERPREE